MCGINQRVAGSPVRTGSLGSTKITAPDKLSGVLFLNMFYLYIYYILLSRIYFMLVILMILSEG
jgi:hypothetical protein